MFSHTILGGKKDNWLVAFYGYGQSYKAYEKLYVELKDSHNIIIIDNPMQDVEAEIHPDNLKKYIADLFVQYNIEIFDSVSYSMGSRFNLCLPLLFPNQLKNIFIIAPDGIKFNFWNRVAISTPWGRRIFKFFVENGSVYMSTLLFFHKIGVVNKSHYAFSKWHMRDDRSRKRVYNAWMNMRFIRPDLNEVNNQIERNSIQLRSYFGKQDPVIPLSIQKRCVRFFPNQKHYLLDMDHNILNEELFALLAKELA